MIVEEQQIAAVGKAVEWRGRFGVLDFGTIIVKTQRLGGLPTVAVIIRYGLPDPAGDGPHGHKQSTVGQQPDSRLLRQTVSPGGFRFDSW